jgi:tRNA pseudouridine55 synthase
MTGPRDAGSEEGGVLLVDKPSGWTSFDVVNKIRRALRVRKAGHAGTLDPMATGLLIVCTGRRTRDVERFAGEEKEYEGVMVLGARTESLDAETPVVERRPIDGITVERIREVAQSFTGRQRQIPPMYSAVKVGGTRLYRYARKGMTVERAPRSVTIHDIEVTGVRLPEVSFRVVCSRGTYIRTLVDDIGAKLGCGAHLRQLRRTRIGPYHVRDAVSPERVVAPPKNSGEPGSV